MLTNGADQIQLSIEDFDVLFEFYMSLRRYCKIQERIRTYVGRDAGMTDAQYYLLRALAFSPTNLSYSQLATVTGLSHNSVSTVAKSLIKSGYIDQHPCPDDGRVTYLSLSIKGEQSVRRLFMCTDDMFRLVQETSRRIRDDELIQKMKEIQELALGFLEGQGLA